MSDSQIDLRRQHLPPPLPPSKAFLSGSQVGECPAMAQQTGNPAPHQGLHSGNQSSFTRATSLCGCPHFLEKCKFPSRSDSLPSSSCNFTNSRRLGCWLEVGHAFLSPNFLLHDPLTGHLSASIPGLIPTTRPSLSPVTPTSKVISSLSKTVPSPPRLPHSRPLK